MYFKKENCKSQVQVDKGKGCMVYKCQRYAFCLETIRIKKNALKMSGVIFYFFVAGPKRVEFPIGISDYGSQCNMLY